MAKRKRATAIVTFPEGLLLVREHKGAAFLLPGGGIEKKELAIVAAIRELQEETGLVAHAARFLFDHESYSNLHQVYELEAVGLLMPSQEIEEVAYYQPGCGLKMSKGARDILDLYLAHKSVSPNPDELRKPQQLAYEYLLSQAFEERSILSAMATHGAVDPLDSLSQTRRQDLEQKALELRKFSPEVIRLEAFRYVQKKGITKERIRAIEVTQRLGLENLLKSPYGRRKQSIIRSAWNSLASCQNAVWSRWQYLRPCIIAGLSLEVESFACNSHSAMSDAEIIAVAMQRMADSYADTGDRP